MRHDGRQPDELRPIIVQRHFTGAVPGSVLIKAGKTTVLCTASVSEELPPWMKKNQNPSGWVTAEYNMLPGSTSPRKPRERSQVDGRTNEIQRLIGRSLRAVVDLLALGPRMITVDCDVLEADGGTRTLSVTGGFIALVDALAEFHSKSGEIISGSRTRESSVVDARSLTTSATVWPADRPVLKSSIAAISVGIVEGHVMMDLDYHEDSRAEVDMNVVMTGGGEFVEVQGTAEGTPFPRKLLDAQLSLAEQGLARLTAIQRETLGPEWPFVVGSSHIQGT